MHTIHFCFLFFQEKFAQISRELPQAVGAGCEVRMNGLGYSVQRPKGDTGEPTVGDTALSCLKSIVCIPCFRRCKHGQASEGKLESAPAGWVMLCICTRVVVAAYERKDTARGTLTMAKRPQLVVLRFFLVREWRKRAHGW